MLRVEIATIALDLRGQPVVILRPLEESHAERVLPIWIGVPEAHAIMLAQQGATAARPQSYDLMVRLIETMGAAVVQVAITRIEDGTFYAEITLATAAGEHVIDARPSDSIALASRTDSPIFVAADVLEEAGVKGLVVAPDDESTEDQVAEFGRFLDSVDPDDFRG